MSNAVYRINIATLIDMLIEIEGQGVTHINIHLLPEQNKMKLVRVLKELPPIPAIKLTDIKDMNEIL